MTPDNSRKTLYQKIWDSHVVREEPGQPSIIYIDRHLIHEGTSELRQIVERILALRASAPRRHRHHVRHRQR